MRVNTCNFFEYKLKKIILYLIYATEKAFCNLNLCLLTFG